MTTVTTTRALYRGALVCGTLACAEVLDRHGCCPEGHASIPTWDDEAVEVQVEVSGEVAYTKPTRDEPGGYEVDDLTATFDGKPFEMTRPEADDAEHDLIDHGDGGAFGPQFDDDERAYDAMRDAEAES